MGSVVVACGFQGAEASVVMAHRFSCSAAYGLFPDQESNPCTGKSRSEFFLTSAKTSYSRSLNAEADKRIQLSYIKSDIEEGGFLGDSDAKESACNTGDAGLIPGSGRSPGGGNGNPLQYSCLENSINREAWWGTVHGVTESDITEQLTPLYILTLKSYAKLFLKKRHHLSH